VFTGQGKSMIYDILNKGSRWSLNVDGEEGVLELLGGSGSSTGGSGWRMNMQVLWQGRPGNLQAESDNENAQQWVLLNLIRQDGSPVVCEGFIASETDRFMAGTSRYQVEENTGHAEHGAWYALKKRSRWKPDTRFSPNIKTKAPEITK
jgi:hypothetical protein